MPNAFSNSVIRHSGFVIGLACALLVTSAAHPVTIRDIARTKGSEANVLVGVGIVVGLNGTGDGETGTAAEMYARHIQRYAVETADARQFVDASNIALVDVYARVPEAGCREGDTIDLTVAAAVASSLEGGKLLYMPLTSQHVPGGTPLAFAAGDVRIEDPANPTTGTIVGGAQMATDIRTQLLDEFGRITLVINDTHASYPTARLIADQINGVFAIETPDIAQAVDERNVVITVPLWERDHPVRFIAPILDLDLPENELAGDARVYVNTATGVILITGNVRVVPMLFSHPDVTLRVVEPELPPNPGAPTVRSDAFAAVDPSNLATTQLQDLLDAFNQMGLDAEARVDIVLAMHRQGMFHAQLEVDG